MPARIRRLCTRFAAAILLALALTSCATLSRPSPAESAAATQAERLFRQGQLDQAARAFLALADQSRGDAEAHYRLRAAEAWENNGDLDAAARALAGVKRSRLQDDEAIRLDLLDAEIALKQGDTTRALALLTVPDAALPIGLRQRELELRARAQLAAGDSFGTARTRSALDRWLSDGDRVQNQKQIVATLAVLDVDKLKAKAESLAPNDPVRPWLEQALRQKGVALARAMPRLEHPVGTLLPGAGTAQQREGYEPPQRVALLLPLSGPLATIAQSIRDGFMAAYFASDSSARPTLRIYDSGNTPEEAIAAYQKAVADGADHVVGPLQREAVGALFHQSLPTRVLALNHPDSGEVPPPGSAEFGLLPDAEGAQTAEHMLERGLKSAAIIAADAEWAQRAARAFRAQFEAGGGHVAGEAGIGEGAVDYKAAIVQATAGLGNSADTGVFISMRPQQARLLLPQLKLAGVAAPVFATSHVYAGNVNPGVDRDLDGLEFCDAPWLFGPVAGLPDQASIARQLPSATGVGARLFAFGMDAYDLLPYLEWLLAHPQAYLDGATGQLAADSFGRIHRIPTWARFEDGVARPVQGALSETPAQ